MNVRHLALCRSDSPRTCHHPGDSDSGAGSVLVLAVAAVAVVLAMWVALVGQVVVVRAEAQSAADLAALAGASRLRSGADLTSSCAVAAEVMARNDADLVQCVSSGRGTVHVTAARQSPVGAAQAHARAGPADTG